jgi:hypothetical protein
VFDDLQPNPVGGGGSRRLVPGIALVDVAERHVLARDRLHRLRQLGDLRPVLCVGGRDVQLEQMPQRVDGRMDLRALPPFRVVITGARSRGGRRLERAAVENHRGGLTMPARVLAHQHAQIMHERFEAAGPQPPVNAG